MALRSSLDLELRPLLRALRNRIDGLSGIVMEPKDRLEVFSRDGVPFMQLEIRRDHMNVDLWLPEDKLAEARATELARPHPFDPDKAVVVRFERATDLTTVARWLEDAHRFAAERKDACADQPPSSVEDALAVTKTSAGRSKKPAISAPKSRAKATAGKKPPTNGSKKRTTTKRSVAARRPA